MKEADALVKVRDGLTVVLDGITELLDNLRPYVDMDKIRWEKAQGPQGVYEKSTDLQNPEYQKLQDDLVKHDGKLTLEGFFVWLFSDGKAIGRKKKQS
jgi:hypothetical protein